MKLTLLLSVVLLNGMVYSQSVYDYFTNQFLADKDLYIGVDQNFVFNFQSETLFPFRKKYSIFDEMML